MTSRKNIQVIQIATDYVKFIRLSDLQDHYYYLSVFLCSRHFITVIIVSI